MRTLQAVAAYCCRPTLTEITCTEVSQNLAEGLWGQLQSSCGGEWSSKTAAHTGRKVQCDM